MEDRQNRHPDIRRSERAGDSDREEIALALREALAQGFIDQLEFDNRLHAAWNTVEKQDLERLISDIPAPVKKPVPAIPERKGRTLNRRDRWAAMWFITGVLTWVGSITFWGGDVAVFFFWGGLVSMILSLLFSGEGHRTD